MEKPVPPGAQRPRGEHFCALLEHKAALIATVPAAAVSGQGGKAAQKRGRRAVFLFDLLKTVCSEARAKALEQRPGRIVIGKLHEVPRYILSTFFPLARGGNG